MKKYSIFAIISLLDHSRFKVNITYDQTNSQSISKTLSIIYDDVFCGEGVFCGVYHDVARKGHP